MSLPIEDDAKLQAALQNLFPLAGLPPDTPVSTESVQEAINKLKAKLEHSRGMNGQSANTSTGEALAARNYQSVGGNHQNVLLVGQLGLVLHQLKYALAPMGAKITLANSIETAVVSYQQEQPTLIIIDVMMPTCREGLGLLQVIRQLAKKANTSPQIVILSSVSSTDDNLAEICMNQGVKHILDRQDGWQHVILDIYRGAA